PQPLLALAELAHRSAPTNQSYLDTLGAALYRAGRWAEAVQRLQGEGGTPSRQLFRAMAQYRLDAPTHAAGAVGLLAAPHGTRLVPARRLPGASARDWLARAEAQLRATNSLSWDQRVRVDYLLREAQALVRGARGPAER